MFPVWVAILSVSPKLDKNPLNVEIYSQILSSV
jgi:hypothetical protein